MNFLPSVNGSVECAECGVLLVTQFYFAFHFAFLLKNTAAKVIANCCSLAKLTDACRLILTVSAWAIVEELAARRT